MPHYVDKFLTPVLLWLCLVLPSIYFVDKFMGSQMLIPYLLISAALIASLPRWLPSIQVKHGPVLFGLTLFVLFSLFWIIYPEANQQTPGKGADDDDALNIAVGAILKGDYPYYTLTYLGNTIHHFAGSFLLATPFVLIGNSALQNIFWLGLFILALKKETGSWSKSLSWFWTMSLISAVVLSSVVTGTALFTNALYVMLGLYWLIRSEKKLIPAIFWGICLASRANFLLIMPLALGWLAQRYGWRYALKIISISMATILVLTVPFYLYDPAHFTPLEAANRLTSLNSIIPHAGLATGIITLIVSLGLALKPQERLSVLWTNCALIQCIPVIAGAILLQDLKYLAYGGFFVGFGIFAAATSRRYQ